MRSSRNAGYSLGSLSNFPESIDGFDSLRHAANNAVSYLTLGVGTDETSLVLASADRFPGTGIARVDNELVFYTGVSGNRLIGVTRGWSGSPVTSHKRGSSVAVVIDADHHNAVRDAIVKLQQTVGLASDDEEVNSCTGRLQLMRRRWSSPEANFRAFRRRGHAPFSVSFQNVSRGFPVASRWDFGDGATSSDHEPTHVFTRPGKYSISLEIFTKDSGYSKRVSRDYIEVLDVSAVDDVTFCVRIPEPIRRIAASNYAEKLSAENELRSILSMILSVPSEQKQFDMAVAMGLSEITYDGLRQVVTFDGGVERLLGAVSPSGDQRLIDRVRDLRVYLELGGLPEEDFSLSRFREDSGQVIVPVDDNSGHRLVYVGEEVEFIDQTRGNVVRRSWVFGDGQTAVTQASGWKIRHTYNAMGVYTPRLSVTAADGSVSSGTMGTQIKVVQR